MAKTLERSTLSDQGPPPAPRPRLPAPVEMATAGLFGALSRIRGARFVHPRGIAYDGTMRVFEPSEAYPDVPLFAKPGEHRAIVRFSRSAGLPEGVPDLLGLTIRIVDAHGRGRHQDFPLISASPSRVGRFLLLPGVKGFFGQRFSSVTLYKVGASTRVVGASMLTHPGSDGNALLRPVRQLEATAERKPLVFELLLAPPSGTWHSVAEVELTDRLPDEQSEGLRFNPWNSGGGIRPTGPLMGLRRSAYVGSQKGRGAR